MNYDAVTITLRDVPTDAYILVIQQLVCLGLYDRASVQVRRGTKCGQ